VKKVQKLYEGDQRAASLQDALLEVIFERATNMPLPTIIGILILLIDELKKHSSAT